MSDLDVEPITRQVVQHAQAISKLRHDLDELAGEITGAYADLVSRISEQHNAPTDSPKTEPAPAPWCWRTIGPHARDQLWAALHEWVAWIRSRYPLAKRIPECWDQHPEVVEELTALWLAWQAAYEAGDGTLTAAAEWHDRWLPGLLHRLERGAFSLDCTSAHTPRPLSCYAPADQEASSEPASRSGIL